MEKSGDLNQTTEEKETPVSRPKTKTSIGCLHAHLVGSIVTALLVLLSLSIKWFDYCLFSFGPFTLAATKDVIIGTKLYEEGDDALYYVWQDELCNEGTSPLESSCPGICDNILSAGRGMLAVTILSILTIVMHIMLCILGCCAIGKKGMKVYLVTILLLLPFVFYFLGIIILVLVGGMGSFESTEPSEYEDAKDYTMTTGFILAIIAVPLEAIFSALGAFFTRNAFK